jgi:hypothetical protein
MYSTPNEKEVERAINGLGIEDDWDKNNIRNFYRRERTQNREANVKLLKALGVFALKVLVIGLLVWACLQTWTERLPK